MRTNRRSGLAALGVALGLAIGVTNCGEDKTTEPTAPTAEAKSVHAGHGGADKTLYIWASDQAREEADFIAVIDFDSRSPSYGKVLSTVPVPPPGNVGNEAHHCHTSQDQLVLACGGLLSLLKGQNSFFFFDISHARQPRFMRTGNAPNSSITDDFLPLPGGGFLVTNMGSASGGPGGRVVELDNAMRTIAEYPTTSPADGGFNPHGIDADIGKNLLVTSDFINPVTTLNAVPGPLELRSSLRFWNFRDRRIVRTVVLPDAAGTMDVKLIPHDPRGRAITANMFTGKIYTVDPDGSFVEAFDGETLAPQGDVRGGMIQLLAVTPDGKRLIFNRFMTGQVVMLDITNPREFKSVSVVNLGPNSGPHSVHLTHDGRRLVVIDYFLDQDDFGKVHLEGDHKVRVLTVSDDGLAVDPGFAPVDFSTAFDRPARPHGMGMK
ncbi:MAG TPA: selenium-binding protein SBP56-related protein [Gemmatimonadales bacterium]|nr:selenium-binding protein SBP56-related protein [Gemmatimonadales bacterium]